MNIPLIMSIPFTTLTIDNSRTEYEIFSTNFRALNQEPIIKFIENRDELTKSVNLSSVFRLIGNDHFKNREYTLASNYYYMSVGIAPIDSPEYGLALSNRSALFFTKKNYTECLKDIELILKSKYPTDKLYKIYARQTECYLNLKQNYDAIKAWANATSHGKKFKEFVDPQHVEKIQKQIMAIIRTSQAFNKKIKDDKFKRPDLKKGENMKFLNASNAVELMCNEKKGRHVVAKSDIEQGDILFVEEPYSAVLTNHANVYNIYCGNCFIFCPVNIPCKSCAIHFYCSENCRQTAWLKAHKWECFGDRRRLLSCDMRLILNTLFEASRNNFDTFVGDESIYGSKENNFPFVNNLTTNKAKMANSEINLFTKYAIYLVIYLKQCTNYFTWLRGQPSHADKTLSDLYDLVGGVILKLCLQAYCNIDEIVDIDLYVNESPDLEADNIGCGLYVSSAMINHSCEPNALISFDKSLKIVRAMKRIPKNTEITTDYGKYRRPPTMSLHGEHFNHFQFKCACSKCSGAGPRNKNSPWLCNRCNEKAFELPNSRMYAECSAAACAYRFSLSDYRTMESLIGPNLLAALGSLTPRLVEGTLDIMKKLYHKENVKFVGYYMTAHQLYFENRDMVKCVQVGKSFVKFVEQFDEINDMKIQAYLRLTASLTMLYTDMTVNPALIQNNILNEIRSSLNETKRLLAFYVTPTIIAKYENQMIHFLDQLIQNSSS